MAPHQADLSVDPSLLPPNAGSPSLPPAPQPPQQTQAPAQLYDRLYRRMIHLDQPEAFGDVTVVRHQNGGEASFKVTSPNIPIGISLERNAEGITEAKPFLNVNGEARPMPAQFPTAGLKNLLGKLDAGLTDADLKGIGVSL
jgi:hypothetical protein